MAYPDSSWEVVRAFFEQGLTLQEIVDRPEVQKLGIKDRSVINKKAKKEGWERGKRTQLVENEVAARRVLDAAAAEKATMNSTEREVHNTVLMERLKTEQFFHNANLTVAKTAVEKLIKERKTISFAEMDAASRVISRSQDSALGKKEPGTSVSVSVNANAQAAAVMPAPDEYGRVLKDLLDRVI